ncbi:MAG: hypothetical protein HZR80_16465 [Candidatus Heimdallarchaeota archaeon]
MIHLQNLSTLATKTAEDRNNKEAIEYNQQLIEIGTKYKLLDEETVKRFEEKIAVLKKKD